MLPEVSKRSLLAILSQDPRPWPHISERSTRFVAEIHLPPDQSEQARALVESAAALGFAAEVGEGLEKSEGIGPEVRHLISIFIEYGPKAVAVAGGVKAALEIPDTLRKLREKLAPFFKHAREVAPQLQVPVVEGWLDGKYGQRKWRVKDG